MEEAIYIVYFKLIAAFLVSYGILKYTIKTAPRVYSLRFISGYYTFQFIALFAFLAVMPNAEITNAHYQNLLFKDYIDETILGYLLFQTGILIAVVIGKVPFKAMHKRMPFTEYVKRNEKYLLTPLIICAFITLLYPLLSFRAGVGYTTTILFNFTKFTAFVAGLLFFHNVRLRIIWILALSVLFILGMMTGGRGAAMFSVTVFCLGFYHALTTFRARVIAITSAVIISIPLIGFLAFVGIFRHMVGRVDFSKIDLERAISIYQKYEKLKDSKALDLNSSEGRLQGWGRLVNFVNVLQFATIPSKKDHLGFENLFSVDFFYAYDLAFISGSTVQDRVRAKASSFRLVDYGYNVYEGYNVEYSIVTDSYIRFGFLGVFVFALIISFFSQLLEFIIYLSSKGNSAFYVFATTMLCQQALFGYAYSLFQITRSMLISIATAAALIALIKITRAFFGISSRRRVSSSNTPLSSTSR